MFIQHLGSVIEVRVVRHMIKVQLATDTRHMIPTLIIKELD